MDQSALLEDLDLRQNGVLDRLAELNASVEALLKECLATRDQACQAVDADPLNGIPRPKPPNLS